MYISETTIKPDADTDSSEAYSPQPILLIREADGNDAHAILTYLDMVCGETDFLTFGPGEFHLTQKEEKEYLETCREAENCLYLLAFLDGEIVGSLAFDASSRPRIRHVGEFGISVLKEHWGLGIASALIDALLEWARHGGIIKKINLRVRADNHRAIALYQRKGFVIEGRLKKAFFVDDVYYDNFCMGLEI